VALVATEDLVALVAKGRAVLALAAM